VLLLLQLLLLLLVLLLLLLLLLRSLALLFFLLLLVVLALPLLLLSLPPRVFVSCQYRKKRRAAWVRCPRPSGEKSTRCEGVLSGCQTLDSAPSILSHDFSIQPQHANYAFQANVRQPCVGGPFLCVLSTGTEHLVHLLALCSPYACLIFWAF
jgi:hypothetical protein